MKKKYLVLSLTVTLLFLSGCGGSDGESVQEYVKKHGTKITSIENNPDGSITINFKDGEPFRTIPLKGKDGKDGKTVTIESADVDKEGYLQLKFSDGKSFKSTYSLKGKDAEPISIESVETKSDGSLVFYLSNGKTLQTKPLKGEKGDKGDKGDPGRGIQSLNIDDTGHLVLTYTDGTTWRSQNSLIGPKGDKGDEGKPGRSIENVELNASGYLHITFSDGTTWHSDRSLIGPKGDKGDKGDKGESGKTSLIKTVALTPSNCGVKFLTGFDNNQNGTLEDDEVVSTTYSKGKPVTIEQLRELIITAKDVTKVNTCAITDMHDLFNPNASFYASYDDSDKVVVRTFNQNIGAWDTSNVTNMSGMFKDANEFNQNISNWDTSKVTDMSFMFYNSKDDKRYEIKEFNQDISSWDTSRVQNMRAMFYQADKFNQDISSWDTSRVEDMSYMFYKAISFDKDLSRWDVRSVTKHDEFSTYSKIGNQADLLPNFPQ